MGIEYLKRTLIMKLTALFLFVFTVVGLMSEADSVTNKKIPCKSVLNNKLDIWSILEAHERAIQALVCFVRDAAGEDTRDNLFGFLSGHISSKSSPFDDLPKHLTTNEIMKIETNNEIETLKTKIFDIRFKKMPGSDYKC